MIKKYLNPIYKLFQILSKKQKLLLCAKIRALILMGAKPVYIRFNQPIVASLAQLSVMIDAKRRQRESRVIY